MTGGSNNAALNLVVDIVLNSEREKRPVFDFLEEPVLFRKVRRWILEGLKERESFQATIDKLKAG